MSPSGTGAGPAGPPGLVCPACRGDLESKQAAYRCEACARAYPVVAGIPDFRLEPDPWIGIEDDRAKALAVLHAARGQGFEACVRAYWAMTPSTPPAVAERFVGHVLRAEARSREWLGRLGDDAPSAATPWLDLGCGTADLLVAGGGGAGAVGVDVALRWLVIARRRLEQAGVEATLVCANAEHLPFGDGSFRRVLALGLVEHCPDKAALFGEVRRVLARGGVFRFRTVNRYSALPEPHVGVWGVGYLPRAWADRWVRWRSGQRYQHHWPEGAGTLRRRLRAGGFGPVRLTAAPLLAAELEGRGGAARLAPLYGGLRSHRLTEPLLRPVAPLLESRAVAA